MAAARSSSMGGATPRSTVTSIAGWELGGTLGRGGFAHVRGAVHKYTEEKMACKILPLINAKAPSGSMKFVEALESHKELVLLKALQGGEVPGVAGIEAAHKRDGWSYTIMPQYDIIAKTTNMPTLEAVSFFRTLLLTIKQLHELHISHGDIKPGNIMVSKRGNPVIFSPHNELIKTLGGTYEYSSPEKLVDDWLDPHACDIWALGILLLDLLRRAHPYAPDEEDEGDNLHDRVRYGTPRWQWMPADLRPGGLAELIQGMLHRDPKERFDIHGCLRHPFLNSHSRLKSIASASSLTTGLPQLPHQLPDAVINDLLFLAYICGDVVLCQSEAVVLDRLKEASPRWEKIWIGMIYDGWCALRRKESRRRQPALRTFSNSATAQDLSLKLKRIDLSPVAEHRRPPPKTRLRTALAPKTIAVRHSNIPAPAVQLVRAFKASKATENELRTSKTDDKTLNAKAPNGPRRNMKASCAIVDTRDTVNAEHRAQPLGPPRRPGIRPRVPK